MKTVSSTRLKLEIPCNNTCALDVVFWKLKRIWKLRHNFMQSKLWIITILDMKQYKIPWLKVSYIDSFNHIFSRLQNGADSSCSLKR